jgi:hypothetical protein
MHHRLAGALLGAPQAAPVALSHTAPLSRRPQELGAQGWRAAKEKPHAHPESRPLGPFASPDERSRPLVLVYRHQTLVAAAVGVHREPPRPVRHCSLTGVAHGQGVGRERLAQRGVPVRIADESVNERISASESKRASCSTSISTSNTSSAPRPRRPLGVAQRPDRDALSFTSAAFTRLCRRAVLATSRQPAHEMPLGRLCGQTTSATTSPICRDFLRGPRRRSNPGPSAYPSVPRSTSQKIRKSSMCRNFEAADGTQTHDLLHGKKSLTGHYTPLFACKLPLFRTRGARAEYPSIRADSGGFSEPFPNGARSLGRLLTAYLERASWTVVRACVRPAIIATGPRAY